MYANDQRPEAFVYNIESLTPAIEARQSVINVQQSRLLWELQLKSQTAQ